MKMKGSAVGAVGIKKQWLSDNENEPFRLFSDESLTLEYSLVLGWESDYISV